MSSRKKVVITDYVWEAVDVEREILRDAAEVVALRAREVAGFLSEAANCDALLNTYLGPITAEVMALMPHCTIIARYGIGVDTIDLKAATAAGIIVTNNPTYCINEVAEHTMALLLGCARNVSLYDRLIRNGRWEVSPGKPMFRLAGKTLGLVGFGNIAREVARRAIAFGMRVVYSDPLVGQEQVAALGIKSEFRELLKEADFVSLHTPLTATTRHMIDGAALALMKPSAYLINCARGAIVDTAALVRALDEKKIAGCALDTTEPEPLPVSHALRGRENVSLSPHVAWYSEEAMKGLQAGAPGEVLRVFSGQWPINVVNPEVRTRNRAGIG